MSRLHSITSSHKKCIHLSFEERVIIQLRIKDNYSIRSIASEISWSPTTVSNEIKRRTILAISNYIILKFIFFILIFHVIIYISI